MCVLHRRLTSVCSRLLWSIYIEVCHILAVRRWRKLAELPITQQLLSLECLALGVFFSFNVLALQFYLGTARLQLEDKGDSDRLYVRILSFIVPGVF